MAGRASLRNPELFSQVHIFMKAAVWRGEIDLAPDATHAAIRHEGVRRPARGSARYSAGCRSALVSRSNSSATWPAGLVNRASRS